MKKKVQVCFLVPFSILPFSIPLRDSQRSAHSKHGSRSYIIELTELIHGGAISSRNGTQCISTSDPVMVHFTRYKLVRGTARRLVRVARVARYPYPATVIGFPVARVSHQVLVPMGYFVFKIDNKVWIDGFTQESCFEMKMRTKRTSRVSCQSDWLPRQHHVVFFDQELRQVPVHRFQSIHVTNNQVVAVTSSLVLLHSHLAIERRVNRVARLRFQVNPVMIAPATPSPEVRCHMPVHRNREIFQIHDKSIGGIL